MASKQKTTEFVSDELSLFDEKENLVTQGANPEVPAGKHGVKMKRRHTTPGTNPLDTVEYEKRNSQITEPSGKVVFELKNLEVPKGWSQLATDIIASKYIRRAGVPGTETGSETSAKQVIHRIVHTIRTFGEENGYFESAQHAETFEAELAYLLINQHGAFNSPVWFNVGLFHEYGVKGNGGNFYWDAATDTINEASDSFSHPQGSACFINSIEDDLMSIFELVKTEAKLFKFGSGTGTNFSNLRSKMEKLSGGGTSSGLISFLEVLDKGAAATKSGGTTRRAAKMVILDVDHPEIIDFVQWKTREERKAKLLIDKGGFEADFNGEAYRTVSGQNSNNSVRVSDAFMNAVKKGDKWETIFRTTGEVAETHKAETIMHEISQAAWETADPGMQYHDTINKWHTCPNTAPINGSNPCSEYMFIDNSACNLASVNLIKYVDEDGNFDVEGFRHACRTFFIAQEILVDLSSYPTAQIAKNSHDFRPLGLGYANLGTLFMVKGLPYDSNEARAVGGAITAIMTGQAYATSAEIAGEKGTFNGFEVNREPMLNVMRMHRASVEKIDSNYCPDYLQTAARTDWDRAIQLGEKNGYRNAQATVLAPTGTIGLLMDCDTTGVEPDYSLVKYKKLAGGGYFKIINQSIPRALKSLGYSSDEVLDIISYVIGSGSLSNAPHINTAALKKSGFTDQQIAEAEEDIKRFQGLNEFVRHVNPKELEKAGFNRQQIREARKYINGAETIEGAPHLKKEEYAIFDTANKCGDGIRFIAPMGHVRMMAAVQPFLSGAISKTVNLPAETTVDDIRDVYTKAWELGLKSIAIYRDGSKGSQIYNNASSDDEKTTDEDHKKKQDELLKEALKNIVERGEKVSLPTRRKGYTYSANIGGQKIFFRTGEYEDGKLGEIFVDMFKAGASYKSLLNCFAVSVSLGLQYGVPLERFVEKFVFTRFEPAGFTDHPHVRSATSVLDFIFRVLAVDYLGRYDLAHTPPKIADDTSYNVAKDMQVKQEEEKEESRGYATSMDDHLHEMDGDAPPCDLCGHITVRNGACYKCVNCGNSLGCS